MVDRLKQEYEGKVEFKLYDVDKDKEGSDLMNSFNAQYVPTFVFVNADGSVSGEPLVGAVEESVMRERLDELK